MNRIDPSVSPTFSQTNVSKPQTRSKSKLEETTDTVSQTSIANLASSKNSEKTKPLSEHKAKIAEKNIMELKTFSELSAFAKTLTPSKDATIWKNFTYTGNELQRAGNLQDFTDEHKMTSNLLRSNQNYNPSMVLDFLAKHEPKLNQSEKAKLFESARFFVTHSFNEPPAKPKN